MEIKSLASVFNSLPHFEPQSSQADTLNFLAMFKGSLSDEDLKKIGERVEDYLSKKHIVFFPKYACVVLVNEVTGSYESPTLGVTLLGLDKWKFYLHVNKDKSWYLSYPHGHEELFSGSIPVQEWKSCLDYVESAIVKAECAQGTSRSAGYNPKGHQKTPAFLASVLDEAVKSVVKGGRVVISPRGGFTDVGLHTGGIPRDTDWPLACVTMEWFYHQLIGNSNPRYSFFQALMRMYLSLTNKYIDEVQVEITVVNIDVIMKMLCHMVSTIMPYIHNGYDVDTIAKSIMMCRSRLDELVTSKNEMLSSKFTLPPLPALIMSEDDLYDISIYGLPSMKLPVRINFSMMKVDLGAAKKESQSNMSSLDIMKIGESNIPTVNVMEKWLLQIAKSIPGTRYLSMHIQRVKTFERWIFSLACNLDTHDTLLGSIITIQSLERCVELYRTSVKAIVDHLSVKTTNMVEILSKETLVVWIVYCMIDYSTRHIHPTLQKYGVSLNYEQLMHLVLSDKLALDAVLSVAKYVHKYSKNPVFSLRGDDKTISTSLSLAVIFSKTDSTIMEIWKSEQEDAEKRVEAHWVEVQRKQALAKKLRVEVDELQEEYDEAVRDHNAADKEYQTALKYYKLFPNSAKPSNLTTLAASRAKSIAHSKLILKQNELTEVEKSPPAVIQPLPNDEVKALSVLFFLFMPKEFRSLSKFSFMAQQMMMPRYQYDYKIAECVQPDYAWQFDEHFNEYHKFQYVYTKSRNGTLEDVLLGTRVNKPEQFTPPHVDSCYHKLVGVWYPDVLLGLGWNGGIFRLDKKCEFFDPFVSITAHSTKFYTATVTCDSLQQALIQESKPLLGRGNVGLTSHHTRPSTTTKNQFISFYDVRAYPYTQIREITRILNERLLSFDSSHVRMLLTMALCQVGELQITQKNDETVIQQLWKSDITHGDGMMAIYDELVILIDEMSEKPRDHQSLPLLIDFVIYLCHGWKEDVDATPFYELRDKCVEIATRWATVLNPQIDTVVSHKEKSILQSNQGLFYMYSMLAFDGHYPLSLDAIESLCITHVMFRQSLKYLSTHTKFVITNVFQYMYRYESTIATRIHEVLSVVQKDTTILTTCIQKVLTSAPNTLSWAVTSYSITCYEAVDSNSNLYSINLLNGIVLFNGYPPVSLPDSILKHPLYQRVFADRNFEIVTTAGKKLRTCKPLQGHYYEFYLHESKSLKVWEIPVNGNDNDKDDSKNRTLELLNYENEWCQQLPPRLRQLHSHWFCRALNTIVFRPINFLGNKISYIGLIQTERPISSKSITDESMTYMYKLYRIASHQQMQPWHDLYERVKKNPQDDVFLGPLALYSDKQPEYLRILSKLELSQYIHIYEQQQFNTGQMNIVLELPRFGLELVVSNGIILLPDFADYKLAKCQQFDDTLTTFGDYLILEHMSNESDIKMIVPNGIVILHPDTHKVTMKASDDYNAKRSYHVFYTHHRTHYLCASTIPDRLLLAALYTATGTYLPETRTRMTGGEYAMYLLRRCMTDQPLDDYTHLGSILQYAWREPALYVLASDLVRSSTQLSFLYLPMANDTKATKKDEKMESTESALKLHLFEDRCTEYRHNVSNHLCNYRNMLTLEEEMRIMGSKTTRTPSDYAKDYSLLKHQALSELVLPVDHVSTIQKDLISLVEEIKTVNNLHDVSSQAHPRPLVIATGDDSIEDESEIHHSALGKEMKATLSDSYNIHTQIGQETVDELFIEKRHFYRRINGHLDKTTAYREALEAQLLSIFNYKSSDPIRVKQHELLVTSNCSMIPTTSDLVDFVTHDRLRNHIEVFGGLFLSEEDLMKLKRRILYWLELCVLEDTLTRLIRLTNINADTWKSDTTHINVTATLKELQSIRTWQVNECPSWLAFEWDGNLQIRPAQYLIAKNLIENPGTIMQLNMGEGKTRVILPMLILYYRSISMGKESNDTPIIRINMLTQLLKEGYEYMHQILTAGILNIPLYNMPFQRSVELTPERIHLMTEHVLQCRQLGGAIFVAPEHRCSLYLKQQMLSSNGKNVVTYTALKRYQELPFKDIIDESDEVLKHKYQLIYAIGNQQMLSSLIERIQVIQVLLDRLVTDTKIQQILADTSLFDYTSSIPGSFYSNIRLLTAQCPQLVTLLIDSILNNPPHDLTWLTKFLQNHDRNKVMRYIMNTKEAADLILPSSSFEEVYHRDQLLALRGLLGHGVFTHCLQKRHRVYYGLAPELNKLIAVPFQACDVPSLRSEFAHPDTALTLTILSYLYDGLSQEQMITAFKTLLKQGPNVQMVHYTQWYETSKPNLDTKKARQINSIDKIDLSNIRQVALLNSTYKKNLYLICYWLRNCMLPQEMKQFSHSLKATAYHLAATHQPHHEAPMGFSGTNDLHVLLPTQVRQYDDFTSVSDEKSPLITKTIRKILATNGRMLDIILKHGTYITLEKPLDDTTSKPWQRLIKYAFELGMSALIDAGALLAGIDCMELATYITNMIKQRSQHPADTHTSETTNHPKFKAVVYHNGSQWVVQNYEKRIWPLVSSPIRECDAFVVFGERHSRGADMKLKTNAQALLTLGPNMCKDKLMQACGRMRQLGSGQKVTIISSYDVHTSISSLIPTEDISSDKVKHVDTLEYMMMWILNNTIKTATGGLSEWASNGIHFSKTYNATKDIQIMNETTVYGMYAHATIDTSVKDAIHRKISDQSMHIPCVNGIVEIVEERTDRYGDQVSMVISQASEEHECEKEQEEEQEFIKEVEIPVESPYTEGLWEYSIVIQNNFDVLSRRVTLHQLSSIISSKLSIVNTLSIGWNKMVYVTTNFIQSITKSTIKLDDYLRRVNHVLLIQDYIILISPMESNGILSYMWNNPSVCVNTTMRIVPLYILNKVYLESTPIHTVSVRFSLPDTLCKAYPSWNSSESISSMLTSIKLFDGHTTFGPYMYPILQECVSTKPARAAVMNFPKLRGLYHMVERSDLEKACEAQGRPKK